MDAGTDGLPERGVSRAERRTVISDGAAFESVAHNGILVLFELLALNNDYALLREHKAYTALCAHISAELVEVMSDLTRGAVSVVGERLNDHRYAAGTVALIGDCLVVCGVVVVRGFFDNAFDVVIGNVCRLSLGDSILELGVYRRISAAACLNRDDQLSADFCKNLCTCSVVFAFFLLDCAPFIMS